MVLNIVWWFYEVSSSVLSFCFSYFQMRSQTLTGAALPVLRQHVIGFASAVEMRGRLLHAVVLAPSLADGAGMDS